MAKAKPKNSAAAFRSLEAELADLYRDEHQTTEEAAAKAEAMAAKAEAHIKDICNLANFAADPGFDERFIHRLRKRFRSSGDALDYHMDRDRLLVRLGEISAEKQKQAPEEFRRQRAALRSDRDEQMAEEYLRKRKSSNLSASDLKAEIGRSPKYRLKRSASIAAVNRGLKSLQLKSASGAEKVVR
jgi:hypothetical protein